jgi:CDP-glucose 4,6-dehydratase
VIITTDKCYDNVEQQLGYVETDRMGGFDPYSCSKGCAELAVSAYRKSYFNLNEYNIKHQVLIGSARAGNVIGGGDWSVDRLVPDLIKGAIIDQETKIRYPNSTRPWQHVLEPISGYLMLGERLLNGESDFADGWNFGPNESDVLSVLEVLKIANRVWDKINYCIEPSVHHQHEAGLLSLNIDKAKKKLGWSPQWNNEKAILKTIQWYDEFYSNNKCITEQQLNYYIDDFH